MQLVLVLVAAHAAAAPCGEVSQEGRCAGKTRTWCHSGVLETETCAACCGFDGGQYKCVDPCPTGCVPECKKTNEFGCSLQNTHAYTCEADAAGCITRKYVACGETQICDESGTHTCVDKSTVDLCGGVPTDGVCVGTVHKQCVNNQIVTTDCGAASKACATSGCTSSCPVACLSGEKGCDPDGQAWTCDPNVVNGCYEKVKKKCGLKVCFEGDCVDKASLVEPVVEPVAAEPTVAEPAPSVPPAESKSGCLISNVDRGFGATALTLGATMLGLLLVGLLSRRRH